jgi:hypothetical protein
MKPPTRRQVLNQIRPARPSLRQIIRQKLAADPVTIRDRETALAKGWLKP